MIRAVIFLPSALVLTGLLIIATMGLPNSIILFIFVGIGALAVNIEAYHTLFDLFATPMTSRGRIERKWSKGRFLFFGKINYILVAAREEGADPESKPRDRLFEVGPISAIELDLGDEVIVHHWPRTNAIVTLEVGDRALQESR